MATATGRKVVVRKTVKKAKEAGYEGKGKAQEKEKSDVLKQEPTPEAAGELIIPPDAAKPEPEKLGPGQKYFEAPDGTLMIGEADKQQLWHRPLNGGRGGWINPKR